MFRLFFIGVLIGCADLVPGVSGGTIVFVTGLYERVLTVISRFDWHLVKFIKQEGWRRTAEYIDIKFILILASGILTSFILFSKLILYIYSNYLLLLNSFFFGLVFASVILISKQYRCLSFQQLPLVLFGSLCTGLLSLQTGFNAEYGMPYVFLVGALGVCATILPGVSGSFILLIFGLYKDTLRALTEFDLLYLCVLAAGAITSLMLFSRLLLNLIKTKAFYIYPVLLGFLLGSLVKLWPWTAVAKTGSGFWFSALNFYSPLTYSKYTALDSHLYLAVLCFTFGCGLMFLFNKYLVK